MYAEMNENTFHKASDIPAVLSFQSIYQSFCTASDTKPLSVIANVSFDVPPGKFVSVIGPSGCGKSTLLQMAAGLLKPTSGSVLHHGKLVAGVNSTIGFVPQQAQLLPWKTLLENVEFPLMLRGVPAMERRKRAAEVIRSVDLEGFESHYPHQLSGGMQKRTSIARMLIYRPDTILMDEPFGALDAQTRMVMQDDLQKILQLDNVSVLFITHDITEAVLLSDSVVVLSRRPTKIISEIPINLPRPRNMFEPFATPGFTDAYEQVWSAFRSELPNRSDRK
jgi:NitT/TauT family transport system ATP-binding protein